jgi:uncharacterized membrane protein
MKDFASIDWADAFSRLHPLLLHLPIGLFVALAWLQLWGALKTKEGDVPVVRRALVLLLVVSTCLAAGSGWLLHEGASYPDPVEWHEWGGISLAAVAIGIGWASRRNSKWYGRLVWLGFFLLIPTAHFGATLTHGEEFLLEPLMESSAGQQDQAQADLQAVPEEALTETPVETLLPVFADVLPVFDRLCTRCHGERRQRGGLAVHTEVALFQGSENGPVVRLGDPDGSLLLMNLRLPLDHDEHMPPENKTQPTPQEILQVEEWIRLGVRTDTKQLAASTSSIQEQDLATQFPEPVVVDPGPSGPSPEQMAFAFQGLQARFAHVQAIAPDSDSLWIDFTAAQLEAGELSSLLEPLSLNVFELVLAGKALDQADLEFVADLPSLDRLDLRRVDLRELDVTALTRSSSIRELNLAGAQLAANASEALIQMESLELVHLWGTGIDGTEGALAEQRPGLDLRLGAQPREALAVEDEVVFERFEEPSESEALIQVENEQCPVTGEPVDKRYVVLYKSRAIGFCCSNCPKTFWQEPGKFLPGK